MTVDVDDVFLFTGEVFALVILRREQYKKFSVPILNSLLSNWCLLLKYSYFSGSELTSIISSV